MKKVMDKINKIYDKVNLVNQWFVVILMVVMCCVLLTQVISRYIFQNPLKWSEELARYMFVWISLVGAAWCGRNHVHIGMTVVTNHLPAGARRVLQIAISLFIAVILFYLFPYAIQIAVSQSKLKAVTIGCSLLIEYLAAPVGIFMMAVQWLIDALYAIFDWSGYKARYIKEVN